MTPDMLAFLTLTTPLLLGGLGLLVLPLLAHWLHRRSQRTIVFPSIALLLETVAQQSQFHRLKRWLLLLLRLFAVACIVLAFARPVWQSANLSGPLSDDTAAAVVMILDLSPSTGQQEDGPTELEGLKGHVGSLLGEMQPGLDVAAVVVADGAPRSLFPRLTANLSGLRQEVSRLQPGFERADLPAALAAAGKLLAAHSGPRRLVVLSDQQRTNWADLLSQEKLGDLLPASTAMELRTATEREIGNVALGRPQHFPVLPLPGEPVDLTVRVTNYDEAVRSAQVRCTLFNDAPTIESTSLEPLTVALNPREGRDITFRVKALVSASLAVRFDLLASDGLAIDNEAWLTIADARETPVIVLSDDDPATPGTAAYYLSRALAPSNEGTARFAPRSLRSAELTSTALDGVQVVLMGYVGSLSSEAATELTRFVRGGGGLIVFGGEGPVDRQLAALDSAAGAGSFLPWSPGPSRLNSLQRDVVRLGNGRWQSRWLRSFDEQSQFALQQIHFDRVWGTGVLAPTTDVLLNFSDGTPAIGTRACGTGQVVVVNFSPEATSSDLARHGAFVALTQSLVQGVLPQPGEPTQPLVGDAWTWRRRDVDSKGEQLSVRGPGDVSIPLSLRSEGDQVDLSLARLPQPGLYRLMRGEETLERVAAGVDPRESDLNRITVAEVAAKLSTPGGDVIAAGGLDAPSTLRGRPLWGEFFAAALAAIGLELFLLGWWRR